MRYQRQGGQALQYNEANPDSYSGSNLESDRDSESDEDEEEASVAASAADNDSDAGDGMNEVGEDTIPESALNVANVGDGTNEVGEDTVAAIHRNAALSAPGNAISAATGQSGVRRKRPAEGGSPRPDNAAKKAKRNIEGPFVNSTVRNRVWPESELMTYREALEIAKRNSQSDNSIARDWASIFEAIGHHRSTGGESRRTLLGHSTKKNVQPIAP